MARTVSFVALIASILICGVVFYQVFAGFLLPLFLAALLVVIFKPLHRRIYDWVGERNRIAAGLTTLSIVLIVLVPLAWLSIIAVTQAVDLASDLKVDTIRQKIENVRNNLDLGMPFPDELSNTRSQLDSLVSDSIHTESINEYVVANREVRVRKLVQAVDELEFELKSAAQNPGRQAVENGAAVSQQQVKDALEELPEVRAPLQRILDNRHYAGHPDFVPGLQEAQRNFTDLRTRLLGGLAWTLIRDLFNPTDEEIRAMQAKVLSQADDWLLGITGATATKSMEFLFGLFILVLALYYFLADGPAMVDAVMHLSPLDDQYEAELIAEFSNMSRAVVLATLLTAIAQGVLAGIGFWFCGIESVFLLMVLTMVLALIPFIGAAAVWAPVCLWLAFVDENMLASILLAIYGVGIISMADNVIKPLVLHGQSNMHPLVALLSVLGGVQALGPVGILVGPMVVAFLQALLNMLKKELSDDDHPLGRSVLAAATGQTAAVEPDRAAGTNDAESAD